MKKKYFMQDGDTALTLASWKGHTAVVKELLAAQADVNVQDKVSDDIITILSGSLTNKWDKYFFSSHCISLVHVPYTVFVICKKT